MWKKKIKEEARPCLKCGVDHMIYNRLKWLCKKCDQETTRQRQGDLQSLFMEIWKERPHVCVKCGKKLGPEPLAVYFSHKKSRGSHPELKMDKNNIELLCYNCHHEWDFGERKE